MLDKVCGLEAEVVLYMQPEVGQERVHSTIMRHTKITQTESVLTLHEAIPYTAKVQQCNHLP